MNLENATLETFAPLVGDTFSVATDESTSLDLTLAEADTYGATDERDLRQPFTLVFHGPMSPVLRQRTFTLTHEQLGSLDIFLVPIGPSDGAMRYEAVFA